MPKVTIIIPVFNCEQYLQECLDSVYAQTFSDYEIIAINDGSTDSSVEILERNASKHKNLRLLNQPNHGQGYARNRAISRARGAYVLFVDADDYIAADLLASTVRIAEADDADAVNFNWQMLVPGAAGPDTLVADNVEVFAGEKSLSGEGCERFLQKRNYYAWDSLYRRDFINAHEIHFGEGYIYEDYEFVVGVASHATRISIIDRPLYTVRHGAGSSSRSRYDSDRHYRDFIRAVKKSFEILQPRTPHSSFYLAASCLEKFIIYYQRRVPHRYLQPYLRDYVDIMHDQRIIPPPGRDYRFLRACIQQGWFTGKNYGMFYLALKYKTTLTPAIASVKSVRRKLQQR